MRKNTIYILLVILALAGAGLLFLWSDYQKNCNSPITLSRIDEDENEFTSDKIGAKRRKISAIGNLALYQYLLDPGKKTRTTYDKNDAFVLFVLEGEGKIHSAHFGEKGTLIWFSPIGIKAGDYLSIPANIAYQLEAPEEKGLSFTLFSLKTSQQKEREFLMEEHPSSYPCKAKEIFRKDPLPKEP